MKIFSTADQLKKFALNQAFSLKTVLNRNNSSIMRIQALRNKIRGIRKTEEEKWKIMNNTLIVALD